MKVIKTAIPEVLVIEPAVFGDDRGYFLESFRRCWFEYDFVQDNQSQSVKNVLRGLHYQIDRPQGKLVRVTKGCVLDVAVDLRAASETFGHWVSEELSDSNHRSLWIPPGFAHGFRVLSDEATFSYKCTDYYQPELERCIRFDDKTLNIDWHLTDDPIVSAKDADGERFVDAEYYSCEASTLRKVS